MQPLLKKRHLGYITPNIDINCPTIDLKIATQHDAITFNNVEMEERHTRRPTVFGSPVHTH